MKSDSEIMDKFQELLPPEIIWTGEGETIQPQWIEQDSFQHGRNIGRREALAWVLECAGGTDLLDNPTFDEWKAALESENDELSELSVGIDDLL